MKKKKEKKENGLVGDLTWDDVEDMEQYFTVQAGEDFLTDEDGRFAFTEKEATRYVNTIYSGLNKLLKDPKTSAKEKIKARTMLAFLKVTPLRVQ